MAWLGRGGETLWSGTAPNGDNQRARIKFMISDVCGMIVELGCPPGVSMFAFGGGSTCRLSHMCLDLGLSWAF